MDTPLLLPAATMTADELARLLAAPAPRFLIELDVPMENRALLAADQLHHFERGLLLWNKTGHPQAVELMREALAVLGSLQQQTFSLLGDVEQQRPGFLQRLFGPRENAGDAAEPLATAEPTSLPVASRAEQTAPLQQPDEQRPQAALSANTLDSLPLAASLLSGEGDDYALPASEPGYSAVAPHIAASLGKLLDELQLPRHHQALAADLRQRLGGTLNWYELVPALDDLAVLVLAVSDSGQREFAVYLSQLNERLASFLDTLNQAQEGYSESLLQTLFFAFQRGEQARLDAGMLGLMVDDQQGFRQIEAVVRAGGVALQLGKIFKTGHQVIGEQAAEEHRFALFLRDGYQILQQAKSVEYRE